MGPKEQHVIIERLIAERRRRGWDKPEMARRLRQELTGGQARDQETILSYVKRWEAGKVGISERYKIAYAAAFKIDQDELFSSEETAEDIPDTPPGTPGTTM
jgi:transcriptional regulator with XRE-family HTH domain